mmetsp:Transcript_1741/g.4067  ORF Transcript_1741/g.4067 Transcript_1741/m.4067 type:complete len:356 (+) Transcript_1741:455-1522(+)
MPRSLPSVSHIGSQTRLNEPPWLAVVFVGAGPARTSLRKRRDFGVFVGHARGEFGGVAHRGVCDHRAFLARLNGHVERCGGRFDFVEFASPGTEPCDASIGKVVDPHQVSDHGSIELERVHPRFLKSRFQRCDRQEFLPYPTVGHNLLCHYHVFWQVARSLNATVEHALKGPRDRLNHFRKIFRTQIANLETDVWDIVSGKVCRVELNGMNLGPFWKLHQTPIVPGTSPAPGFPPVQDFSLFAKGIGVKERGTILQKILGNGKPVVCRKEDFSTVRSTREVLEAIGEFAGVGDILGGIEPIQFETKVGNARGANGFSDQGSDGRFHRLLLLERLASHVVQKSKYPMLVMLKENEV